MLALPSRASADPGCNDFYVLFARGSGATLGGSEEKTFTANIGGKLSGASWAWAELGNLDGDFRIENDEYPAHIYLGWISPGYQASVKIGVKELIKHLNQRYGNGPGDRNCSRETLILGGYSQGADVLGWALEESPGGNVGSLSSAARSHIGSVALYGDPRYLGNYGRPDGCYHPPWAVVNLGCPLLAESGQLTPRAPYVPYYLSNKVSSYCAADDGMCRATLNIGTHATAYTGDHGQIANSAWRVAGIAHAWRRHRFPSVTIPPFAVELPLVNVPAPSAPVRDSDNDGLRDPDDACPNEAGLPLLNGCPPPKNRRDIAWYDDRTLWGFKSSGLHTVAERQGFGRPDWAGVGDYDHDGREDLFWYHETSTTIYVILGGDFTRVIAARGPGIGRPVWASTGDFDGNGFRDEIAWYDGTMLFLLRGQGLHTVYETAGYSRPDWVGVGDQNQDGKDDLFWYHGGGNGTIYAIPSNGGGFNGAYAVRGPGIGAPQWAGVGDFDGNGRRNDLAWYGGGWLFTFTGPGLVTTGERYGYAMNDWAGTGKCDSSGRDSLFWYHGGGNGTIYCIMNNGRQFTDAYAMRGPGIGPPTWAGTGDMYP